MKSTFEMLQPLGRALMLPIAVLPVAGLLLRLGQPDLLGLSFVAAAGDAIFSNLGLLFAVGVAVGLARENHGAAGLAGVVCFLVATSGAKSLMAVPPDVVASAGNFADLAGESFKAKAIAKLGVPTGIVSGLIAGWLYNRFHTIKMPDYLAFFGGRRFVPIAAGFAALLVAALLGLGWPAISGAMDGFSHAVVGAGSLGLFLYGALNRLLIVTGLHHILNNIAWFILGDYHGVTGDLKRFFAGDPGAGSFMTGFFPVMMFGLPAACLAMYHTALPGRRKAAGGVLFSMALTAFLTGVTEPIEFSFMFLAPLLYAVHAVLTGFSMVVMHLLGVKLGFGFSAGLFDYVLNFHQATRPLLLLPVGAVYFGLYYLLFRTVILRFDLKTLGREEDSVAEVAPPADAAERGTAFVVALGGAGNLQTVDACTTRLRLIVRDTSLANEVALKSLGARGFVRPSEHALQVVLGPVADQVAGEIRAAIMAGGTSPSAPPVPKSSSLPQAEVRRADPVRLAQMITGLGGVDNIVSHHLCASRLCVRLRDLKAVKAPALDAAGVRAAAPVAEGLHLILGEQAASFAAGLAAEMGKPAV